MSQFVKTDRDTLIPLHRIERITTKKVRREHLGHSWNEMVHTLYTTNDEEHGVDAGDLPETSLIVPNANPAIRGISVLLFQDGTNDISEMSIVAWRLEKFSSSYIPEPIYLADYSESSNEIRAVFDSEHGRVWGEYDHEWGSKDSFIKYALDELIKRQETSP